MGKLKALAMEESYAMGLDGDLSDEVYAAAEARIQVLVFCRKYGLPEYHTLADGCLSCAGKGDKYHGKN